MSRYVYDGFLSRNSADKPAVEAIARRLRKEGGLHTTVQVALASDPDSQLLLDQCEELSALCRAGIINRRA